MSEFYTRVVGFEPAPANMGDYDDFNMNIAGTDEPGAGICHRRGNNADLPAQWMVYFVVADLGASVAACNEGGGEIIVGPKGMGDHGRYCVIRDPAGAVAALFQPAD
ncbi:MAG: VOC family protein [bacterium]|nr:VOC family protein [bacterium]